MDTEYTGDRQAADQIKVMVSQDQWRLALEDASIGRDPATGPATLGLSLRAGFVDSDHGTLRYNHYVGFVGSVSTLASFMLAARERFGPYDSEMLARIVVARETGQAATRPWPTATAAERLHFYFPGLELY